MFEKIKNNTLLKTIFNTKNLGLYLLLVIALSVTWGSIQIIQQNYQLEKQINQLQLEADIQERVNKNTKLKNEYYKTDAYLDWAARKYFGKSSPGEKIIVIPAELAQKYTHPENKTPEVKKNQLDDTSFINNIKSWLNFFLHHRQTTQ